MGTFTYGGARSSLSYYSISLAPSLRGSVQRLTASVYLWRGGALAKTIATGKHSLTASSPGLLQHSKHMAVSSSGGASRDLLPVPAAERRSTRSLSGQQELNSQLSDLLGGWEEEEETRNDGEKSQSSGQSKPTTSLKNPAPKKNKTTGIRFS